MLSRIQSASITQDTDVLLSQPMNWWMVTLGVLLHH